MYAQILLILYHLVLAVVSEATEAGSDGGGVQASVAGVGPGGNPDSQITYYPYAKDLEIPKQDQKLTFRYLDKNRDDIITRDEVIIIFSAHIEAEELTNKFFELLDCQEKDQKINEAELCSFMATEPVILALYECTFERSVSLRRLCYEDRMSTYVHLVLPRPVITEFYKKFDNDADGKITKEEATRIFGADQVEGNIDKFMMELGGKDETITIIEFTSYVSRVQLHDSFKACIKKDQYNYDCMRKNLLRYTIYALTELDLEYIFGQLDEEHSGFLEPSNIVLQKECQPPCDAEKFLLMMNRKSSPVDNQVTTYYSYTDCIVSYGEFRTFVRKYTVQTVIERNCRTDQTMTCYLSHLLTVVSEHSKISWLNMAASDQLLLFEALDKNDDGEISLQDLVTVGYSEVLAKKFMKEADGKDLGQSINTRELNEFIHEPSALYTLSGCFPNQRGHDRTECYLKVIEKYITLVLSKEDIWAFYKYYAGKDLSCISEEDALLERCSGNEADVDLFLSEISIVDSEAKYSEFKWFVKQVELGEMFDSKKYTGEPNKIEELHMVLFEYLKTKITETDIRYVFDIFDSDHSNEIEMHDLKNAAKRFGKTDDDVNSFVNKFDLPPDYDKSLNYLEFRLFLVMNGRKQLIEKSCLNLKKAFKLDMSCLGNMLWTLQ